MKLSDFNENYGSTLLKKYHQSPFLLLKEVKLFPDFDFKAFLFQSVPKNYFDEMENRRSYIKWLMERVKVKDLAELRSANFNENHGAGLLQKYNGSVVEVLNSLNLDRKATEMKPKATPKKYWLPPTFFFPSSSPTLRPFSPFLYPYIVSYICIYILLTLLFRICSKIVEGS